MVKKLTAFLFIFVLMTINVFGNTSDENIDLTIATLNEERESLGIYSASYFNDRIYIVGNDDIIDKDTISNRLLISPNDVDDFVSFVTSANINDCSVVLFRFANTEYYSKWLDVYEYNEHAFHTASVPDDIAFVAQQNIFLDFDIIQLTFNKDGIYTVVPAVSNPIDVISDIDTPEEPDNPLSQIHDDLVQIGNKIVELWNKLVAALGDFETNWWKYLLVALAIIVGVPIAFYLIKTIVTLPWKLIKQHERNQRSKKYRR